MAPATQALQVSELFSVKGLIAVISGGGSGKLCKQYSIQSFAQASPDTLLMDTQALDA